MNDDFLHRDVPAFRHRIFRLGLSTTFGIGGEDLDCWIRVSITSFGLRNLDG